MTQKEYCCEVRCKHVLWDDGWEGCNKNHDELPLNEDGDIECDDYDEAMPDDFEEDNYDGRDLE